MINTIKTVSNKEFIPLKSPGAVISRAMVELI